MHADGHFQLARGNCWESSGGLSLLTVPRIMWVLSLFHKVVFNLRSRHASCRFDIHAVTSPALELIFVGKEERAAGHDGCSTATRQLVNNSTAPGLSLRLENRHGVRTNAHYLVSILSTHDGGRQLLRLL